MIKKISRRRAMLAKIKVTRMAALEALTRLNPLRQYENPAGFVWEIAAILASFIALNDFFTHSHYRLLDLQIAIWLWIALVFVNFIGALVEKGGTLRAEVLLKNRRAARAKLVRDTETRNYTMIDAKKLAVGDIVLVEAGDIIPLDGEVVEGIASVDESAITGESATVLRESSGSRSNVTGGTRVVSDFIYVRITAAVGENFADQVIDMAEDRERSKTPTETSLMLLVAGLSLIFLMVTLTTGVFAHYSGVFMPLSFLIVLLSALLPLPLGGLLVAISTSGMSRLGKLNVVAKSARVVESAWDIGVAIIDKTGTITLGNRIAVEFIPMGEAEIGDLAEMALAASFMDETPEGKSISALAMSRYDVKPCELPDAVPVPFSAHTRMSGIDYRGGSFRKGAVDAIFGLTGGNPGDERNKGIAEAVEKIALAGGTPLLVTDGEKILGAIHLKDVIKPGMKERFQRLRRLGVRTVMITGDNPMTVAAIAAEAGVDDFVAEATPETKLALIEKEQQSGRLVAMVGDGTNDAPALAQADIGLVMNNGTQGAREAGNVIDLDFDPTTLIEIITVGRQMLITRGGLAVFCLAGIMPKYLALLPALLARNYSGISVLNVTRLATPESAVLSVSVFDALVIIALLPMLVNGVKIRDLPGGVLLIENLVFFGVLGFFAPLAGIKLIDMLVNFLHLV